MIVRKRGFWCSALLAGAIVAPTAAQASTFDISLTFSGLTASQESIFTTAETFWETAITGYNSSASGFSSLAISATGAFIDGVGGILGSAGPSNLVTDSIFTWASAGAMTFDSADLTGLESNGSLQAVILHEMAHVIGIGTLWSLNDVYTNDTGEYTGANALAAYQAEFDSEAMFVPVELGGGPGTANGHWDEGWAGGPNELMTGYLDTPTFISDTTIASFADIGYTVDLTANDISAVPIPPSIILMGSALGLMGLWSRRRRSRTA
jgi:hypothetical protein